MSISTEPVTELSRGFAAAVSSKQIDLVNQTKFPTVKFLFATDVMAHGEDWKVLEGAKKIRFSDGENEADIFLSASGVVVFPPMKSGVQITIFNHRYITINGDPILVAETIVPGRVMASPPSPSSSAPPRFDGSYTLYGFGGDSARDNTISTPPGLDADMQSDLRSILSMAGRTTVTPQDIALVRRVRGERVDPMTGPSNTQNRILASPVQQPSNPSPATSSVLPFGNPLYGFGSSSPGFTPAAQSCTPQFTPSQTQPGSSWSFSSTSEPVMTQNTSTTAAPNATESQQQPRFRPGAVALAEIRRHQTSTDLLIHKLAFLRLLREIFQELDPEMRIQPAGALALQEATEAFMISFMEDANLVAIKERMVTVLPAHMRQVMKIRAAAAGIQVPEEAVTSANILRTIYGMPLQEDHDGDDSDDDMDQDDDAQDDPSVSQDRGNSSSYDDGDDDDDDGSDMEVEDNAAQTADHSHASSSSSHGLEIVIGDKLHDLLEKRRDLPGDPLPRTYISSADASIPVMVIIEEARAMLVLQDNVPLHLTASHNGSTSILNESRTLAEQLSNLDSTKLIVDVPQS